MDRDTTIRLARGAGIPIETDWAGRPSTLVVKDGGTCLRGVDDLERFAALVAAHEREECAQIAAQWDIDHPNTNFGGCIANLIRSRGT